MCYYHSGKEGGAGNIIQTLVSWLSCVECVSCRFATGLESCCMTVIVQLLHSKVYMILLFMWNSWTQTCRWRKFIIILQNTTPRHHAYSIRLDNQEIPPITIPATREPGPPRVYDWDASEQPFLNLHQQMQTKNLCCLKPLPSCQCALLLGC